MNPIKIMILLATTVGFLGCTQNDRAKNFGGEDTIVLPCGHRLITATWKDTNLWYLSETIKPDQEPRKTTFKEKSSIGLLQGTVIFVESTCQ